MLLLFSARWCPLLFVPARGINVTFDFVYRIGPQRLANFHRNFHYTRATKTTSNQHPSMAKSLPLHPFGGNHTNKLLTRPSGHPSRVHRPKHRRNPTQLLNDDSNKENIPPYLIQHVVRPIRPLPRRRRVSQPVLAAPPRASVAAVESLQEPPARRAKRPQLSTVAEEPQGHRAKRRR